MASENKMITLRSSDGELFEVEDIAAMESQTLRHLIEDGCADSSIPLPNVSAKTLSKIIEYCRIHVGLASVPAVASKALSTDGASTSATKQPDEDLKNWDKEFIKVDLTTLYYLLLAANYLSIRGLLDLVCQTVADMMKGKSPEEIRQIFNIKNDFTPEEEEQIRRENQWAFE